ncbi:hypothetical protein ACFVVL_34220 [Kitasatospora sp. NPDC058115]|uniref:hypothetical protein n=1 Tax=Kitasatospora sp. NPDC058115 TaxID=3346347 RepID=UPI0036DA3889
MSDASPHAPAPDGAAPDAPAPDAPVHRPGDPTPVTDPPHGPVRGCLRAIGEFVLELVGEAVLGTLLALLTTASLAAVVALTVLAFGQNPVLTCAVGTVAVLLIVLGVRQLRRPKERRGRLGRILAAVTAGLGVWLLLCVVYASWGAVLAAASF